MWTPNLHSIYLKMKSNCEKASIATPGMVDRARWVTGANMCSFLLSPLAPKLPTKLGPDAHGEDEDNGGHSAKLDAE